MKDILRSVWLGGFRYWCIQSLPNGNGVVILAAMREYNFTVLPVISFQLAVISAVDQDSQSVSSSSISSALRRSMCTL